MGQIQAVYSLHGGSDSDIHIPYVLVPERTDADSDNDLLRSGLCSLGYDLHYERRSVLVAPQRHDSRPERKRKRYFFRQNDKWYRFGYSDCAFRRSRNDFCLSATEALDVNKKKYLIIAVVASVLGIIPFVNSYFHVKERVVVPPKKKVKGDKGSLARIFTCKPLMLVILMGVLSSGRYLMQAAAIHVSRYAFDASANGVFIVLQVCAAAGSFGAMLFMPALMKKFEYKSIVIFTALAGFFASIVTTIVGWTTQNFYICAPFILLQCLPIGVLNTVSYAMIGDCLDYMEVETGFRDTALGSSCQGFVNKLGNSLATAGISLMYIFIGLNPADSLSSNALITAADLAAKQRFGMFSLVSIVPGICFLLCAIPIFFYDLTGKKKEDITRKLAEKRKAEGIVIE